MRRRTAVYRVSCRRRLAQPKKKNAGPPYTFWGICSMLYAFLALPTVYALRRLPAAEVRERNTLERRREKRGGGEAERGRATTATDAFRCPIAATHGN